MFFPIHCPGCGARGAAPCARCAASLRHAPALPPPSGLDSCRALLRYEDVGRELLTRLKYRNTRATVAWLAWHLAGLVPPGLADAVTWAPTSGARRRARGFDQAQLLAVAVASHLDLPCRRLLVRGPGPPQTGQSIDVRRRGPPFELARHVAVPPSVILVDDIVTSGATMTAAATALRAGGAASVHGLAAARTPLRHRRSASAAER